MVSQVTINGCFKCKLQLPIDKPTGCKLCQFEFCDECCTKECKTPKCIDCHEIIDQKVYPVFPGGYYCKKCHSKLYRECVVCNEDVIMDLGKDYNCDSCGSIFCQWCFFYNCESGDLYEPSICKVCKDANTKYESPYNYTIWEWNSSGLCKKGITKSLSESYEALLILETEWNVFGNMFYGDKWETFKKDKVFFFTSGCRKPEGSEIEYKYEKSYDIKYIAETQGINMVEFIETVLYELKKNQTYPNDPFQSKLSYLNKRYQYFQADLPKIKRVKIW